MKRGSARRALAWFALASAMLVTACEEDVVRSEVPSPSSTRALALVVNGLAETLTLVDLDAEVIHDNVLPLPPVPNQLVDAGGRRVWVVSSGANRIDAIDTERFVLLDGVDLGADSNPWEMAIAADGTAYVTNWLRHDVARIDLAARRVLSRIPVEASPQGVAVAGGRVFVASTLYAEDPTLGTRGVVNVLEGDQRVATVGVGRNPQSVVAVGDEIHVVCTGRFGLSEGVVMILDAATATVVDSVTLGGSPAFAVPAEDRVYVAGFFGGLMSYSIVERRPLHDARDPILPLEGLFGLAYDSTGGGRLYVAGFADDLVHVVESDTLVASWGVGDGPQRVLVHRAGAALPVGGRR